MRGSQADSPDALVVSGVVAGKARRDRSVMVPDALAEASCPVFMIPGNVDGRETMREAPGSSPARASCHLELSGPR